MVILLVLMKNQKPWTTLLKLQDEVNIVCILANHFPNHFRRVAQGVILVVLVVLVLVLVILY